MAAPILRVEHLSAAYDGHPALDDVTFAVMPGDRIAVVGPNGAGKSTLFKAVTGILPPQRGDIVVHGHAAGVDACVAYVPQRSQVDATFPIDVEGTVMMGRIRRMGWLRRPSAADRAYVRGCLAAVGLDGLAGRQIGELSGGQQQRVFIARALAQEAELMLMDEPFTGLDAHARRDVLDVLDALDARGVAVMVATHDLALAAEAFERAMLLNRRLVAFGPPADVFTAANLVAAYGGNLRLVDTGEGRLVLGDTGCHGDEPHG